ncbi:MAG: hypothetical protein RLZZ324_1206 [Candidatus Parcubacteria bacterium]|jgi:hypothetical protein
MVSPELLDYIRQHKAAGTSDGEISSSLITAGWPKPDVDAAMQQLAVTVMPPPAPPMAAATLAQPQAAHMGASPAPAATQPAGTPAKYQLPGTKQLLTEAWAMWHEHYRMIVLFTVLQVALTVITGLVAPEALKGSVVRSAAFSPAGVVLYVVQWIMSSLFYIAILRAFHGKSRGESLGVSLYSSLKYILPFVLVGILQAFVAFGSLVLVIGPMLAAVWFIFVPNIIVNEGIHGMNAIVRGRELTRDRWWVITGYGLLLTVIAWILAIPFIIVIGIAYALSGGNTVVQQAFGTLMVGLLGYYAIGWQVSLYNHLRIARGPIEPFPKPGQMKWYWILAALGLLLPIIFIITVGATLFAFYLHSGKS